MTFLGFFDPTTNFLISTASPWRDNWTLTLDFTLAPANLKNAIGNEFMTEHHKVTVSDGNSWGRMHRWLSNHIGESNSVVVVLGTFSYELAKAPPGKPLCLVTPGEAIDGHYEPLSPPSPPAHALPSSRASSAPAPSTSQLSDQTLVNLTKPCQYATTKTLGRVTFAIVLECFGKHGDKGCCFCTTPHSDRTNNNKRHMTFHFANDDQTYRDIKKSSSRSRALEHAR